MSSGYVVVSAGGRSASAAREASSHSESGNDAPSRGRPAPPEPESLSHREAAGRFVQNEELGVQGRGLVAAPADFNAAQHLHRHATGVCFACRYTQNKSTIDRAVGCWNKDDLADAFSEMQRLIQENYGKGVSNEELVDMVHEFYETEIRALSSDDLFAPWTKESIYQHIVYHSNEEAVQLQECENILYSQIQSLRQKTWVETEEGSHEPHHRNIALLEKMIKSFTESVAKRKARKAAPGGS